MKTHISIITVDWAHCDAAGIVFYPNFYTWFDQGTERLFRANGLSYSILREKYNLLGLPLVETGAKYMNACRHGDEIELQSWVEKWDKKTLLMHHRILHTNGIEALVGFERRAWAVFAPEVAAGMRADYIPEEVRQLFKDPAVR